ncbi:Hypothetical protein PAU_03230 [Photorhabdus asymbiotica]|uniref:Uncharacterized protein n=1 Tax=Photorhabdus asymbiotica subsp. asymbiotica (strain ATCC 43949 / 3105-77) TaxID=553480 RepID=C7BHX6_PHOAA|nr:Hypothetical protein PAU_03230 [Photorhabdus asymbiotica]
MLVTLESKEYHVLQYKGGFPVSHAIKFIETSIFTRQIKEIATDDDLKNCNESLSSHQIKVI